MASSDFLGMFITTFADDGPKVVFNSSPFSRDQALNLGIQGMTTLQNGTDDTLYGPLPTVEDQMVSFAFKFRVKPKMTDDARFLSHGRTTVIWLVVKKSAMTGIFNKWKEVEGFLQKCIQSLSLCHDTDLTVKKSEQLKQQIELNFSRLLSSSSTDVVARSTKRNGPTVEYLSQGISKGEVVLDHGEEVCYLLVDEKTVLNQLKKTKSLGDWMYAIQMSIRAREGKWYGMRLVIDSEQREMIKRRVSSNE